uniref:Urotensin-2 receptor n=1 Tax=Sinocyclocheilus grahami TaxID=75366 RepID=A0A672JWX8_SINGR
GLRQYYITWTCNLGRPDEHAPASSYNILITSILGTILTIMCLVGVIGNIYSLIIMNTSVRVTGSMYVYIVNLALDLLYLSTIPFVVWTYFARDWYFGDIGCRVLFNLDLVTMHASIFILTIMSTERYLAVVNPLCTPSLKSRAITCLVWLFSFILALPIMIDLKRNVHNGVEKRMCHPTWQMTAYRVCLTILFNTCILAPGLIIGYLYLKLARTSQTSIFPSRKMKNCPKQKVLYMIFSIVLTYWACFIPFWLWQFSRVVHINFVVTCLAYSNSCINPFLYTLLTRNYQEYVRDRQKNSSTEFKKRFRLSSLRSVSSGSQQFCNALTNTRHSNGILDAYSEL